MATLAATREAPPADAVHILSKRLVQPSRPTNEQEGNAAPRVIHLTVGDLDLLSISYIQKGILFRSPQGRETSPGDIISGLLSSFSRALDHFYPLAGRFVTLRHTDTTPPSLSVHLECNDEGAEFVHAAAPDVSVSDILDSHYVPAVVSSFFPLNGVLNHDGHRLPLLSVQVNELADGIFVGCSFNHAVGDGVSFWQFFNAWSEISRTGDGDRISKPPVLDRWFPDSCPPPIRLPYSDASEFIQRSPARQITECAFHFPAESVAKLKARANAEMGKSRISSLQSLLAHLWLSVTRARGLEPQQETAYILAIGGRNRVSPPLPEACLCCWVLMAFARAPAGELLEKGLGWAAWLLNQEVASYTEEVVRAWFEEWARNPTIRTLQFVNSSDLLTGSSPRFDVYGNDFGWGKPVAVRSGWSNKPDGKATVYEGPQKGSMGLEVCLSPEALRSLMEDQEFMKMVGNPY